MKLKVKKLYDNAVIPKYGSEGAACFDLVAISKELILHKTGPILEYDTGLAFEIPKGHVGLIFPRSSITKSTTLTLGNCVGVIDSDYRGSVKFQFRKTNSMVHIDYEMGDRIGQMMIVPIPSVELEEVTELSDTQRNEGGFGSTGV
jgi:dUTP pyrophosphatase